MLWDKRPGFLMRGPTLVLCCLLLSQGTLANAAPEEIELIPVEQANWSPRNLLVALVSVLGGWTYWYGDRYVTIETVPADADLSLYYIRANFQKCYERAKAPVRVRLPRRSDTTTKDYISVRGSANGFATTEKSFNVRRVPSELLITLEPLPNALVGFNSAYIAGRTTLVFRSSEQLQFRISKNRESPGFILSLTKTADKLAERPRVSEGVVENVDVSQLGEDILIRVTTRGGEPEVRSKQGYDPVREEYFFVLDLVPEGSRTPSADQVRRSLESMTVVPDDPCHLGFESALRDRLTLPSGAGTSHLAGGLAGIYRRELMLRLGRLERGTVHTVSGETLRTGSPIELELALQDALNVKGYPALLHAFARTQDEPESVLRTLIAPNMSPEAFNGPYVSAESAWEACSD
jgi:hypothetical protein